VYDRFGVRAIKIFTALFEFRENSRSENRFDVWGDEGHERSIARETCYACLPVGTKQVLHSQSPFYLRLQP
jgi:hypothetical protein